MKEIHPFLPKSNGDLEENGRNEWKMKEIPPFLSQFNENLEENGRKRYKDEGNSPRKWKNQGENRRTEDVFARNGCENVKKKEEMGERDLDKGTFAHYILRIAGCMLLSFQNQEKGPAK